MTARHNNNYQNLAIQRNAVIDQISMRNPGREISNMRSQMAMLGDGWEAVYSTNVNYSLDFKIPMGGLVFTYLKDRKFSNGLPIGYSCLNQFFVKKDDNAPLSQEKKFQKLYPMIHACGFAMSEVIFDESNPLAMDDFTVMAEGSIVTLNNGNHIIHAGDIICWTLPDIIFNHQNFNIPNDHSVNFSENYRALELRPIQDCTFDADFINKMKVESTTTNVYSKEVFVDFIELLCMKVPTIRAAIRDALFDIDAVKNRMCIAPFDDNTRKEVVKLADCILSDKRDDKGLEANKIVYHMLGDGKTKRLSQDIYNLSCSAMTDVASRICGIAKEGAMPGGHFLIHAKTSVLAHAFKK